MRIKNDFWGEFYYLICLYRAEMITRNELILRWEKRQKGLGITVHKKLVCID